MVSVNRTPVVARLASVASEPSCQGSADKQAYSHTDDHVCELVWIDRHFWNRVRSEPSKQDADKCADAATNLCSFADANSTPHAVLPVICLNIRVEFETTVSHGLVRTAMQ